MSKARGSVQLKEHPGSWLLAHLSSDSSSAAWHSVWELEQPWPRGQRPSGKHGLGIWRNRAKVLKGLSYLELILGWFCPHRKQSKLRWKTGGRGSRGQPRSENQWMTGGGFKPIAPPSYLVHQIKMGRDFILLGRENGMGRDGATRIWIEPQWTVWANEVMHVKCLAGTRHPTKECSFSSFLPPPSNCLMANLTDKCLPFSL